MQQLTQKRFWMRHIAVTMLIGVAFLAGCGDSDDLTTSNDSSVIAPGTLGDMVDVGDLVNSSDGSWRYTIVKAMNEDGSVVGQSNNGNPAKAAFIWNADTSTMTYLGIHSEAYDANGSSDYEYSYDDYFGLNDDTSDDDLAFIYSEAVGISSDGDVIGNSTTGTGWPSETKKRAFYYNSTTGNFIDLTPGYYKIKYTIGTGTSAVTYSDNYVVESFSEASCINDDYVLVTRSDKTGQHAYYWDKSTTTTIPVVDDAYDGYAEDEDDDPEDILDDPTPKNVTVPAYSVLGNDTTEDSEPVAINANNQAVMNVSSGERFIVHDLDNDSVTDVYPISSDDTISAAAINDSGNVAGTSGTDAFLWSYKTGNMTLCGNLCDDQEDGSSVATAINNGNQVVGYATNDDGEYRAFLWDNGAMTDLGTLGGDNSWALAVNDNGVVIGYSETGETYEAGSLETEIYHACAWYDGKIYDLGVITDYVNGDDTDLGDYPVSVGVAINNGNRIMGNSYTINDFSRGFVLDATFPE